MIALAVALGIVAYVAVGAAVVVAWDRWQWSDFGDDAGFVLVFWPIVLIAVVVIGGMHLAHLAAEAIVRRARR